MDSVNGLMLQVFVPALVFDVMSSKDFAILSYQWLMLSGVLVVLGSGIVAFPFGRWFGFPMRAYMPAMMFNNCGNLGLPLAVLAFGDGALEAAVVLFLASNLLHFTLGVFMFGGIVSWKGLLMSPVNIATFLGLVVNFGGLQVPDIVLTPISMMGQIVIPLMLFSLGVRMISVEMQHWRIGLFGAIICPLSGIIPALVAGYLLPLDDYQFNLLLLFSALPPAVLNFLLSERYNQRPGLVASRVLMGNALSVFVLTAVLWWRL
ncbi:MAG: AEC family transporter [Gammaproteobacteria bacterium]|nr:AEC family transporter [Gammaproteobacteria bacterium]